MNYEVKREFERELGEKAEEINRRLEDTLRRKNYDSPPVINEAVEYALISNGKRLRPILTLETAKAISQDTNLVEPLAEAIEMIHSYSLIHDDLPAMDNGEMRHGKPTVHRMFGEDVAVLAGDALLNMAMERALEGAPYVPYTDAHNYLIAMRLLFNHSGLNGMIGGQVADSVPEAKNTRWDNLDYIQPHKTGALISAAILCGAIPYLGMNDPDVWTLYRYGDIIGRIFQIMDDILDEIGDPTILGKDVGSDVKNKTNSFISVYGLKQAREEIERLREDAYRELNRLEGKFDFLYYFTDYLCSRVR